MMNANEPTTGEIIQSMRRCGYYLVNGCDGCRYNPIGTTQECTMKTMHIAADRLESQEQKLELLNGGDFDVIDIPAALAYLESVEEILPHASALIDLIQSLKGTAIELTARAEQAEAREKAAVADMHGYCQFCGGYDREEDEEPCNTCTNARTFEPDDVERTDNWEYRGQPQDGEGK